MTRRIPIIVVPGLLAAIALAWRRDGPPVGVRSGAVASTCTSLNASSIGGYRNLIGKALEAARQDAIANGTDGAYKVAATNSRDILQRAYDRAGQMVDFNQNQGNRNPNVTTYAEAGTIKVYLQSILNTLPDAAHWATISAIYHKSQQASDAFDRTIVAMNRGSQLMGYAGRCYVDHFLVGTP